MDKKELWIVKCTLEKNPIDVGLFQKKALIVYRDYNRIPWIRVSIWRWLRIHTADLYMCQWKCQCVCICPWSRENFSVARLGQCLLDCWVQDNCAFWKHISFNKVFGLSGPEFCGHDTKISIISPMQCCNDRLRDIIWTKTCACVSTPRHCFQPVFIFDVNWRYDTTLLLVPTRSKTSVPADALLATKARIWPANALHADVIWHPPSAMRRAKFLPTSHQTTWSHPGYRWHATHLLDIYSETLKWFPPKNGVTPKLPSEVDQCL